MKTKYYVMEIDGKKLMRDGEMTVNSDAYSADSFHSRYAAARAMAQAGLSFFSYEVKTEKQVLETFQNA